MKNLKTVLFFVCIIFFAQLHEIQSKSRSGTFSKIAIKKNKMKESSKSSSKARMDSFIKNRNIRDLNQSTDLWIKCSNNNEDCVLPSGTYVIKYGIGSSWKYREMSGRFACNNNTFGPPRWICLYNVPLRFNNGNVECMSHNGRDCTWRSNENDCINYINNNENRGDIRPLACGDMHNRVHGGTGYDNAAHWCFKGREELKNQVNSGCWVKNNSFTWRHCAGENGTCNNSSASIIKYGADSRWSYQFRSDNVSCSNGVFGDPVWGTGKSCFILEDNTWRQCAGENGVCSFMGSSLVRYGIDGRYNYRLVNGSINCNNSTFGDPFGGRAKFCDVRIGPIVWIPCANENGNCTVPGEAIVRYGANMTFSLRKASNSIGCNNGTFGDPTPGVFKKCEYAIYNNQDLPPILSTLADQEVSDPLTKSAASSFSSCSDNRGFGFTGTCLTRPSALANNAPDTTKNQVPFIFGVLGANPFIQFNFCAGDFTGEDLGNHYEMSQNKCNSLPLMKEYTYGSMSGVMRNVPCGKPVEAAFCVTFDRCGTVALVVNGGLLTCAAAYSTGIGAILSLFSDVLDYIGFGISVKRRFSYDMDLAFRDGSSVGTKTISTYGHFFLKIGLALPLGDLSLGGKKLKDFFTLNVDAMLMVDFGNSFNTVGSIINEVLNANRNTGRNIVDKIVQTNSEITFAINGSIVLNINTLTNGFLPNIEINIAKANLLLTLGNGGASGLNRGVYFYYSRGLNNIGDIFNAVVAPIRPLLNIFGVSLPGINFNLNAGFGMFVSDDSLGVTLVFPGISIYCLCIYSNKSCSCGVNGSFFTALLEAGKWLVKQARQIAETVGRVAVEFANETGRFAVNAANATANFFRNDARNFFERDVKNAVGSAVNEVGNFFKNDVGNALNTAGSTIANTASTVGNAIASGASTVGNAIASVFRGW